MEGTPDEFNVK
jgi:Co/Zn/Cd efflux system component